MTHHRESDPTYGAVCAAPVEDDGHKHPCGCFVYFLHAPLLRRLKIGFSVKPKARVHAIRSATRLPKEIETTLIGTIDGGRATERVIHERFAAHRITGEWFSDEILPDVESLIAEDREWFGAAA